MALRQGMNNMTSRASLWLTFPLGDQSRPPLRSIPTLLLLLLLSRFSCVRLCETPWMAAHQAPPFLVFSRQEHWSGLPFPSPTHACMLSHFSHVRLRNPIDGSPPGSSVHRILQARILEWVAIFFSYSNTEYLWKQVKMDSALLNDSLLSELLQKPCPVFNVGVEDQKCLITRCPATERSNCFGYFCHGILLLTGKSREHVFPAELSSLAYFFLYTNCCC